MRKDLENEDIMTYIHYLGVDDNVELFEDLKDEIRFVIGYSKRNNLDFCLVDDFENGYFKDFELVKHFDKLCCIKEKEEETKRVYVVLNDDYFLDIFNNKQKALEYAKEIRGNILVKEYKKSVKWVKNVFESGNCVDIEYSDSEFIKTIYQCYDLQD